MVLTARSLLVLHTAMGMPESIASSECEGGWKGKGGTHPQYIARSSLAWEGEGLYRYTDNELRHRAHAPGIHTHSHSHTSPSLVFTLTH